jgi:hypothetical protein
MELIINKEKEYAYYDAIGNAIITLNVKLQFQNALLVYLGEL